MALSTLTSQQHRLHNPKAEHATNFLTQAQTNKQTNKTNKNLRCGNRKGLLGRNDQTHHRMGPKTRDSTPPIKRNTQAYIQRPRLQTVRRDTASGGQCPEISIPERGQRGHGGYHSCQEQISSLNNCGVFTHEQTMRLIINYCGATPQTCVLRMGKDAQKPTPSMDAQMMATKTETQEAYHTP